MVVSSSLQNDDASAAFPAGRRARRRLAVIYNPTAGQRRLRRYAAILAALRAAGCEILELPTLRPGDAERLAAALTPAEAEALVVAGGDGTINEAANGLLANEVGGRTLPLGVLPLGTANVLAAEIGLRGGPAGVVRCLLHGRSRPVALGRVNGRHFVMMAGVGFDAHVVARVNLRLKRGFGKLAYVAETLRQFLRYGFPLFRVEVDGRVFEAASVVVANGHYYGGRFVMAPDALLEAAELDVVLFRRAGRLHALKYAAALVLGLLPRLPDVSIHKGRRIRITGPAEDPVQADGDVIASLPAEFLVLPDALNLLFPD